MIKPAAFTGTRRLISLLLNSNVAILTMRVMNVTASWQIMSHKYGQKKKEV